ncbi:MAG: DUF2202 domain-containing protein, partial [Acidobacteriota bacterium]
ADYTDQLELSPLSQGDIDGLNLMREEEKLARDVYLTLGERWSLPIFFNIARAEQKHMDRVLSVMDLYEMTDPVTDDTVGIFVDQHLADLYTTLVDQGAQSLVDALIVGATIEDLDIFDLNELISIGTNDHLLFAWQNLNKGSRNHMRAFISALNAQEGAYQPQYIDQDSFDAILASEWERGIIYNADGEVLAECGGTRGGRRGRGNGQGGGNQGGNGTGTGNQGGNGSGGNQGGPGTGDCDGSGNP